MQDLAFEKYRVGEAAAGTAVDHLDASIGRGGSFIGEKNQ
jgi:hypothetical protein